MGVSRVVSIRTVVDLPAPLGPRNPKISPSGHLEVDAVDGGQVAEATNQPAGFDRMFHDAPHLDGGANLSQVAVAVSRPVAAVGGRGGAPQDVEGPAGRDRERRRWGGEHGEDLLAGVPEVEALPGHLLDLLGVLQLDLALASRSAISASRASSCCSASSVAACWSM